MSHASRQIRPHTSIGKEFGPVPPPDIGTDTLLSGWRSRALARRSRAYQAAYALQWGQWQFMMNRAPMVPCS